MLNSAPTIGRAVRGLLIALAISFVLQHSLSQFAGINAIRVFGFWPLGFMGGRLWQLVTYPFLHASLMHLLFNCAILYMLGSELERRWGSATFVIYYALCGIGGALLQTLISLMAFFISPHFAEEFANLPIIGASGAIFGLYAAFGMLFGDAIILAFFFVPMKAKHFVALLGAIEMVSAVFFSSGQANDGVAHLVHLGGLATGFIILKLRGPNLRGGGGGGGLFRKRRQMDRNEMKRRLSVIVNNEPDRGDRNYPITWN
jgi:membrane associated rhomboid family serine protease